MAPASLSCALLEPRLMALRRHLRRALGGHVKAVHQARVASRRLREVLPVVGGPAGARRQQRAFRRVRRVTRAFGPVRELDVTLQVLAELSSAHPDLASGLRAVRRLVVTERRRRRTAMLDQLGGREIDRTLRAVQEVLTRLDAAHDEDPWRVGLARQGLERARRLADAVEDVGLLFDPRRLHGVRIEAKKLRYSLELSAEARLAPTARLVATLKDTQEQLGRLHDLQVLLVFVRQAEIEATSRGRKALAALRDVVERECHREHARYLRRRRRLVRVCQAVGNLLREAAEAPGWGPGAIPSVSLDTGDTPPTRG